MRRLLAGLVLVLLVAGGCGAPAATPTASVPPASPSPSAPSKVPTMAFFVRDQVVVPVRRYAGAADESRRLLDAVQAMLAGPTAAELQAGYSTAIPPGTVLRALTVTAGAISIDLSRQFEAGGGSFSVAARLAQLVFTVTQVQAGAAVTFTVEGTAPVVFTGEGLVVDHPVGRDSYEQLSPAILILSPLPGDTVSSPVRVSGTANVYEAQFSVDLVTGGQTVTVPVQATSGTGTRGGFVVSIDAGTYRGAARIVPWDASPRDGSRVESPAVSVDIA